MASVVPGAQVPVVRIYDGWHEHNSWEVVRMKKDLTTVRCRECQFQVKLKMVKKCVEFASGGRCGKGAACRDMHVHQYKMTLEERVQKYGTEILERVPRGLRKGLEADEEDAPPLLLEPDDDGQYTQATGTSSQYISTYSSESCYSPLSPGQYLQQCSFVPMQQAPPPPPPQPQQLYLVSPVPVSVKSVADLGWSIHSK